MQPIVVGDVVIHYNERRVEVCGTVIELTEKEWNILESLGLCAGSLVTRRMLLAVSHAHVRNWPDERSVDAAVSKTRAKIAAAAGGVNYIEARWREGYVLRPPA